MMEDPFDQTLDSFFNQLINPFSDQENHLIATQLYLHNKHEDSLRSSNGLVSVLGPGNDAGKMSTASSSKNTRFQVLQQNEEAITKEENNPENEEAVAKQKNRRVNQNIASRNYRNRKKEYVTSLENKVAQLATENEQLKKEIASIKRVDNFDLMRPDPLYLSMVIELKHVLDSMDEAIKKNADDNTISYLLQLFHLVVEKRQNVYEKEVEKLVNPFAQAKLAVLGYAPVLEYPAVSSLIQPSAESWWNKFIGEAKVTLDQSRQLNQIKKEMWNIDQELKQERVILDKSIKEFFLQKMRVIPNYPPFRGSTSDDNSNNTLSTSSTQDNQNLDVSDIIELSRKLNSLKKNFCTQRNLMINAFSRLGQILTPRQQAMLLVRINISTRFDGSNLELLKSVWQSVTSSETPSVLSLLSMLPQGHTSSLKLPLGAGATDLTALSTSYTTTSTTPPVSIPVHSLSPNPSPISPSVEYIPPSVTQQHPFRGPL
jgi:hypothetical protein